MIVSRENNTVPMTWKIKIRLPTKNIVHLADSSNNEDDNNKET